jgi:hypothetical protein
MDSQQSFAKSWAISKFENILESTVMHSTDELSQNMHNTAAGIFFGNTYHDGQCGQSVFII